VRVLIVEDEPVVARRIERLTRAILGDRLRTLAVRGTLGEAQAVIESMPLDVLLLDLNLSGRDGFSLLQHAVAGSFHTIVISANTDRAMEAFEYGVLDYVAKPFNRARLEGAFNRALGAAGPPRAAARVLAIRKRDGIVLVPSDQIVFIRGAGPYAELHLRDGGMELHSKSLDNLLAVLPHDFERTHKSFIVRMSEIARVIAHEGTRYELELRSGRRLPIGRTRYQHLRAKLQV
jgi:two-component system, LytTR family, response regulator LytT